MTGFYVMYFNFRSNGKIGIWNNNTDGLCIILNAISFKKSSSLSQPWIQTYPLNNVFRIYCISKQDPWKSCDEYIHCIYILKDMASVLWTKANKETNKAEIQYRRWDVSFMYLIPSCSILLYFIVSCSISFNLIISYCILLFDILIALYQSI